MCIEVYCPQLILLSISIEEQCKCLRKNFNGAVAQLMEFIDRSGSSFALIKRFLSLQKTQKIKWQHKQGLHSPTHSCCFLCDFVFAVEIASRLPALNFAVQFPDVM